MTAVLVSPTRVSDFLAAKGILGTAMAFAQAVLLLLIIGSFANQPLILLCALLLGAVLVTGFGLIAGAAGKDFIETLFYGMAFMIPLMIPAIAVLFPGTAAVWVKDLAFLWLDTSRGAGQRLQRRLVGGLAVSRHAAGMEPGRIRGGMGHIEAKSGNALGQELRKCCKSIAMNFTRTVRPEPVEGPKGERRGLSPLHICNSGEGSDRVRHTALPVAQVCNLRTTREEAV